jgi:hypothetical protein
MMGCLRLSEAQWAAARRNLGRIAKAEILFLAVDAQCIGKLVAEQTLSVTAEKWRPKE